MPDEQRLARFRERQYPHPISFEREIGGTVYTVNAHFREGGRDLLSMLMGILERNISGMEYRQEGEEDEDWEDNPRLLL